MATTNVRNVNADLLNSTSVKTTQQTLEEDRKKERKAYELRMGKDSVSVAPAGNKVSVASSGEPTKPQTTAKTPHQTIQSARDALKKALVDAGVKIPNGDVDLETMALDQAEVLQNNIDKLLEEGAPEDQIAKEEAKREALLGAKDKFASALNLESGEGTVEGEGTEVETASGSEGTNADTHQMTEEEQGLWANMDIQLKAVGIDRAGETSVDNVQKKFLSRIGSEVAQLREKETGLNAKYQELLTQYKNTKDPKARADLEKSLLEIKSVLTQINQRKLDLQTLVTNFNATSDSLLSYHVSHELGLAPKKAAKSAKVQSASAGKSDSSKSSGSSTQKTDGSQAGLSVQSAGGAGGVTGMGDPQTEGEQGPLLGTASAGGDSYVAPKGSMLETASKDLTGTQMSIASGISATAGSQKAEAQKLDKLIKKLILAAQSGNMDAVVSGLIYMSKRANILTTSIGAQTLVAMQQYEKQMGAISSQIGALKSKDPDYSSKLASLNANMSIYSSSRQQIVQTFQSTLSMKEQMDELPHSVIQKLGQLGSRLASFQ